MSTDDRHLVCVVCKIRLSTVVYRMRPGTALWDVIHEHNLHRRHFLPNSPLCRKCYRKHHDMIGMQHQNMPIDLQQRNAVDQLQLDIEHMDIDDDVNFDEQLLERYEPRTIHGNQALVNAHQRAQIDLYHPVDNLDRFQLPEPYEYDGFQAFDYDPENIAHLEVQNDELEENEDLAALGAHYVDPVPHQELAAFGAHYVNPAPDLDEADI